MVNEDLAQDIPVQPTTEHENMLTRLYVHFVHDALSKRDCVDQKRRFVGNGGGQGVYVVHAREHEITVKPVRGFARNPQTVGGTFVLRYACKIYPFAFADKGIVVCLGNLTDCEPAGDKGCFYLDCARIHGDVRFGEQGFGNLDLDLFRGEFQIRCGNVL